MDNLYQNDYAWAKTTIRRRLSNFYRLARPLFKGTLISNGGYDKTKGNQILASRQADLVSFGKLFLANPDLPKRFELNAELNTPNPKTFYGRGEYQAENGYTDYPTLELQVS